MSQPLVTIVTATWNRPGMFSDCAEAVFAQTFQDWVWWVVLNDLEYPSEYKWKPFEDPRVMPIFFPLPYGERHEHHVPSQIVNWLYPKVTTPYIYWLSDDDLIDPHGLGMLVEASEPQHECDAGVVTRTKDRYHAVYGCCEVVDQQPDGSYKQACWCYPGDPISTPPGEGWDVGGETGVDPHCRLDGGQVLHTKALWDQAIADGWRQFEDNESAAAQDGLLLRRLAQFARFHFVPTKIVTHRRHAGAKFHRPQL